MNSKKYQIFEHMIVLLLSYTDEMLVREAL